MGMVRASHHYTYLLRCADGSYYAGYTIDPARRLAAHRRGRAARYTRGRGPHVFVALWRSPSQRSALRLERLLKRLSHAAKHRLALGRPLGRLLAGVKGLGVRRVRRRR
jgi:putative endonuclease